MEGSDGSPPNSMYMVKCRETFPKPLMEKEDDKIIIPFTELPGEGVKYIGTTSDGILALTNYRIFVLKCAQEKSVPLGLIDTVQSRDLFHLFVYCKDANTVKCSFETADRCSDWQRRITVAVSNLVDLESLFAFPFYAWSNEIQSALQSVSSNSRSSSPFANHHHSNLNNGTATAAIAENEWSGRLRKMGVYDYDEDFKREVDRLQFNLRGAWRISKINEDFKLCPSYPRYFLVPIYITDETLQSVANFRSSRRIPVAVWRHKISGAIIARCSQPEVGWLGWRNSKDEELLQAFVDACAFDRGEQQLQQQQQQQNNNGGLMTGGDSYQKAIQNGNEANGTKGSGANFEAECTSSGSETSHEEVRMDEPKKLLIVDARSYTSAVTNRARGGGCECIEYYPSADIQFMSLANIHAIRKSFHGLRQLCASSPDMTNWLSNLEKTMWLQHLSGLLAASVTVCRAIELNGRPVLVHCSDGWDRTPQIVATAQLCLDPYYRTVDGFRTLVEREWLSFGHKFGDRCGHGPNSDDLNERCPVFLQWLDCIHQIHLQFPCSFEFSMGYLIKLAQHSHSCLFGTFVGNTVKERSDERIFNRTYSVWPFLSGPMYKNPLYMPNRDSVLWPAHNLRDLSLWNEVYLGNLGNNQIVNTEISSSTSIMSKLESVVGNTNLEDERMVSMIEDGVDEQNDMGRKKTLTNPLSIDLEEDQVDREQRTVQGEPTSPMSKTRSYGDLLEANGTPTGSQRRCSDPTMPLELLKYNTQTNQSHTPKIESSCCDKSNQVQVHKVYQVNGAKAESAVSGPEILLPNLTNNNIGSSRNAVGTNEAIKVHSSLSISTDTTNQIVDDLRSILLSSDETPPPQRSTVNKSCGPEQNGKDINLIRYCPNAIEIDDDVMDNDSVDGRTGFKTNYNVMLESVDLRDSSVSSSPVLGIGPELSATNRNTSSNLWHGNIETSTDTLVPVNDDKRDGMIVSSSLNSFITKDEESRLNQFAGSVVQEVNGQTVDLNSVNLNLLNSQSIYDSPNTIVHQHQHRMGNHQLHSNDLNHHDNNIQMSDVIQTQPLAAPPSGNSRRYRRRRNSSNSKSEISPNKFQNGNVSPSATNSSRFSTPGPRSLPLTPPGGGVPFEKSSVAISCPDGLAHALSEQNIRLQQIIFEHKLREEALQRELSATKMALLKRICYHCNNTQPSPSHNDEQNNNTDGGENASVCSWEAVEERGTGSETSSANNSCHGGDGPSKVLWVPDHAVNKCTECSNDFWIGRRKHHCRSCGKIFCSDCSEFFAPLPDERLYNPVRLCGPCYHAVTTKIQLQQQQQQQLAASTLTATTTTITAATTKNMNFSIENQNYTHYKPPNNVSTVTTNHLGGPDIAVMVPKRCADEELKLNQSTSSQLRNSYGLDMATACKSSVGSPNAPSVQADCCSSNGLKTATASN